MKLLLLVVLWLVRGGAWIAKDLERLWQGEI